MSGEVRSQINTCIKDYCQVENYTCFKKKSLSPDGSAEHKGEIEEVELLFLTKCRITFQNVRLSLF